MSNQLVQLRATRSISINRVNELLSIARNAKDNCAFLLQFRMRCSCIEDIKNEFESIHLKVVSALATAKTPDLEGEDIFRIDFDNAYYEIKSIQYELFDCKVDNNSNSEQLANRHSNVKLPKIKIPNFNGNVKDWPTFIDLFNTLIHHNSSLSNIEKFHYLITSLSSEPLLLLKTIPLTDANYVIAYKALNDRYQNKRLLATNYWNDINKLPKLQTESPKLLRNLLDTFCENLSGLELLGFPVEHWDFILFNILLQKLDFGTAKRFEMQYSSVEIPTFDNLKDFLTQHCKALESVANSHLEIISKPLLHKTEKGTQNNASHFSKNKPSFPASFVVTTSCPLCNSNHFISNCSLFLEKSPNDRYLMVKKKGLCINCLRSSHRSKFCQSYVGCKTCGYRHHTLLHFNQRINSAIYAPNNYLDDAIKPKQDLTLQSNNLSALTNTVFNVSMVLLSTAIVDIIDSKGTPTKVRVLLDTASQANFITEGCAQRLGFIKQNSNIAIQGLGNSSSGTSSGSVHCSIRPCSHSTPSISIETLVIPQICSEMPTCYIPLQKWEHIANLKLADPNFNTPSQVDLLLGADVFASILTSGHLKGNPNEPVAINTIFGWILMGKVSSRESSSVSSFLTSLDKSLDSAVNRFSELEELPQVTKTSPKDLLCKSRFSKTHFRNATGRYVVSLPFGDKSPQDILNHWSQYKEQLLSTSEMIIRRRLFSNNLSSGELHGFRSDDNPPDCGSRGLLPFELKQHSFWWAGPGPPWLLLPHNCWPNTNCSFEKLEESTVPLEEEKRMSLSTLVSLDSFHHEHLHPDNFLTLEPLATIPDQDVTHLNISRLDRWQFLQRLHQDFWKRWHNEYLHTLQQTNKWIKPPCNQIVPVLDY